MVKRQLCIRANNRKNGVVNRSLHETPVNSFECFKETVMRSNYKKCSKEIIIRVEELFRAKEFDPIYELLLFENGVVMKWAKVYAKRYNLDWCELFSEYQYYLYNMLDGVSKRVYNINMPFIDNLYKQLECETKDIRKRYNAKKRMYDWNCKQEDELENEVFEKDYKQNSLKDIYKDVVVLMDLESLKGISPEDKGILIGIATGEIDKKDIPHILDWSNKEDRMKLSRYTKKLQQILNQQLFS